MCGIYRCTGPLGHGQYLWGCCHGRLMLVIMHGVWWPLLAETVGQPGSRAGAVVGGARIVLLSFHGVAPMHVCGRGASGESPD